ncbi:MAG: DUF1697 domain-containing protein [Yoonia sp.]|uniref:DUF1697 domain-containing protein n=1 Tax=Yoonia sp. TaxID=2212373 RepID=UPI003EF1AC5B
MMEQNNKWVALLRGVNVGGGNKVPMADLRGLAEGLGWRNVRSYIASGNLVFEADAGGHAKVLRAAMVEKMGVDVPVLVLPAAEVEGALEACPWDGAGNLVHVFFCWEEPKVDIALHDELIAADEEMRVDGTLVWFHAPSGVGRSKLMGKIGRVLGVQHTARNLNTLRKLADMVQA